MVLFLGKTALIFACSQKLEKICLVLIEKGCDLNVQEKNGKNIFIVNPLFSAPNPFYS